MTAKTSLKKLYLGDLEPGDLFYTGIDSNVSVCVAQRESYTLVINRGHVETWAELQFVRLAAHVLS